MRGRTARRGSVLMEFVLSMPLMITLIFLVVQFAQIWTVRQVVAYSAFCATRSMLSAAPSEWSSAKPKSMRCDHRAAARALAWVNIYSPAGGGKRVPGWGTVPQSASVDDRVEVESSHSAGEYATSKVTFKFPLLVPVAGQMISYLAKNRAEDAKYSKIGSPTLMWSGEEELFEKIPYIELTERCVLPLPFDPSAQPANAYAISE